MLLLLALLLLDCGKRGLSDMDLIFMRLAARHLDAIFYDRIGGVSDVKSRLRRCAKAKEIIFLCLGDGLEEARFARYSEGRNQA